MPYKFELFHSVKDLPAEWDVLALEHTLFHRPYLKALEASSPVNMRVFFIGLFSGNELIGLAIAQLLDLKTLEAFGSRDNTLKSALRKLLFRRFASKVLIVGNNMLTGEHAFVLSSKADRKASMRALLGAAYAISTTHGAALMTFKDFYPEMFSHFNQPAYAKHFRFSTQPNMVLDIRWHTFEDYLADFHKKYRDQYKRARNKIKGLQKRELSSDDLSHYSQDIYERYENVAENAPFNTFFLAKNHFETMKRHLGELFKVYAYFDGDYLVGFYTTIKNGPTIETYFLGYDNGVQRSRMLYLNMLYDMIEDGVRGGFSRIVFSRTALEIKSSVGAVPEAMYGLMLHRTGFVQKRIGTLFKKMEPDLAWQQRHPFKSSGNTQGVGNDARL